MAREPMNAQQAKTFRRYSMANAMILSSAAAQRGCSCEPYKDWFTFRRWLAQGYVVRKGEHGVKISTYIETEHENDDGTITTSRRPWTSTVFCRCQVEPRSHA